MVIGLTGGIATGKSTVSILLAGLGLPVIDADVVAREIVMPGEPALQEIASAFGPKVLNDDGTLNRKMLGGMVFGNRDALALLNSITHPRIIERIIQQKDLLSQTEPLVVLDIPLLFESGLDYLVDEVWCVYVPRNLQKKRLMLRDGYTEEEAELRLDAQLSIEEKMAKADVVIDNTGSVEETELFVRSLVKSRS